MSAMTLPHTNGSKARHPLPAWMQASVQQFFTTINWEDNPAEVQEIKLAASEPSTAGPLSLSMSVSQFFASLNWDDTAIAAPVPPAQPSAQPPANNITLDDFSDLF